jgi:hypothetical protein
VRFASWSFIPVVLASTFSEHLGGTKTRIQPKTPLVSGVRSLRRLVVSVKERIPVNRVCMRKQSIVFDSRF